MSIFNRDNFREALYHLSNLVFELGELQESAGLYCWSEDSELQTSLENAELFLMEMIDEAVDSYIPDEDDDTDELF